MRARKITEGKAVLFALGLAVVIVPRLADAAVVVADPTGDADPAFLAELKASLETVAAEAPPDVNGELRSSAELTVAGVELVVELAPNDGKSPIRMTRVASKASALSQARAMARAVLKTFMSLSSSATEPTAQAPVMAANVPQPAEVIPLPEPPKPPPAPPLAEKYDRRIAIWLSLFPTVVMTVGGGGLSYLSVVAGRAMGIPGMAIATIGLSLGPSLGYFWIGRTQHALVMAGVRLAALGVGITFMALYVKTFQWGDGDIEQKSHPGFLITSIIGFNATLAAAFVDAGLVGRAADRANVQWRESQKVKVQVAPVAWSNGNGDGTFGLAVSGAF